mmetsp:Transcript_27915/g.31265  ORF Transcript_27915/g.31265 Transcript_27915/m.31265 type:complete len:84 (-) Transcript_27915:165-416(-)
MMNSGWDHDLLEGRTITKGCISACAVCGLDWCFLPSYHHHRSQSISSSFSPHCHHHASRYDMIDVIIHSTSRQYASDNDASSL